MTSQKALIRRPSPQLAEGIDTHHEQQHVDYQLACRQWDGYVDALENAGWQTVEVPAIAECPDGVFVEDTMVVLKNVAVIASPGAESRKPEVVDAEKVIEAVGYSINRIRLPGTTLDGGDVLEVADTIYIGRGEEPTAPGFGNYEILGPIGAAVVGVPITRILHSKSAVTALPDGTVIGYLPLVDDPLIFDRFVPVPEDSGAQVLDVGAGKLLIAADCPSSVQLLTGLSCELIRVNVSEFRNLEGCVACLSVQLRGDARGLDRTVQRREQDSSEPTQTPSRSQRSRR